MNALLATTYRSGSQWLYYSFKDAYREDIHVFHEPPIELMTDFDGIYVGFTVAKWAEAYKEWRPRTPLVHVVRHPVAVAQSAHFVKFKRWDIALQHWVELHRSVQRAKPNLTLKIEDIWAEPELLHSIAGTFGLPMREKLTFYEGKPIGESNPEHLDIKLTPEAAELAQELGYENE